MRWLLIVLLSAFLLEDLFAAVSFEDDKKAKCVPLKSCPPLLELLQQQPLTPEAIKYLRSSTCGFDGNQPKVHCRIASNIRSCTTPEGKKGACMPARNCLPFIELLQTSNLRDGNVKEYLRRYQCESNGKEQEVCCEIITDKLPLVTTSTTTTTTTTTTPNTPSPTPITHNLPNHFPRPSAKECGTQNLINKITGGTRTELDEFPWTVLLQYQKNGKASLLCGGSLISKRYVATAAHCVDHNAIRAHGNIKSVVLGEYDTQNEVDCIKYPTYHDCADPSFSVDVEEITIHPQWEEIPGEINHDIALIRLVKSVPFSEYVKPICLPSSTLSLKEGDEMHLAGWGQTETSKFSTIKLKTTVPITSKSQCIKQFRQRRIGVGNGLICAGGAGKQDSCRGDSGGPLMLPIQRDGALVWFLAGIVSFGPTPCGTVNQSALYTDVSKYMDWIYSSTRP